MQEISVGRIFPRGRAGIDTRTPIRERREMSDLLHPRCSFRRPTELVVGAFLREQSAAGQFSYAGSGATRDSNPQPAGYTVDHNRVRLGAGEAAFAAAGRALSAWRMFPVPWTQILPEAAPIRAGQTVAMLAHACGLWWLSACRIVYRIDETLPEGPVRRRFGFAYGTLHAHVEQGEERFSVELLADGSVWYDLLAFSRPQFWPVRLARPLARGLQRRFVRESQAAMLAAVAASADT
jgi:uncharacterized protein (UPF0548 family)